MNFRGINLSDRKVAMGCILLVSIVALIMGINDTLPATSIGLLAGLGGIINEKKNDKKSE